MPEKPMKGSERTQAFQDLGIAENAIVDPNAVLAELSGDSPIKDSKETLDFLASKIFGKREASPEDTAGSSYGEVKQTEVKGSSKANGSIEPSSLIEPFSSIEPVADVLADRVADTAEGSVSNSEITERIKSTRWSRYAWSKAVDRIWKEDGEFQELMVRHILKAIRGVSDDAMLDLELASARKDGLFYCPNDDYMEEWLGESSTDLFAGIYGSNGLCRYTQRLVIPIRNFADEIPGFIGYSNDEVPGYDDGVFVKYTYPPKDTLIKGRFMYITGEEYIKAIEDGYICIVDGIFDKRRLTDYGYNAVSLMGSAVTFWHKLYLSKIKHIIVIRDNDQAGYKLLQTCKKAFPGTIEIAQGDRWDIDDFLKTPENLKRFAEAFERVKRQGFLLSESIRKPRASRKENLENAERRRREEAEEAAKLQARDEE